MTAPACRCVRGLGLHGPPRKGRGWKTPSSHPSAVLLRAGSARARAMDRQAGFLAVPKLRYR
jgi:hypothetical protein